MTSPLPTWQYLVAFNNNPLDDPASITTVASPAGTLGAANVWTDITPWVLGHKTARGRQHELDRFETGTCTIDLGTGTTNDSRFNPWNTAGPYTGKLVPNKLVQVRATYNAITYKRFTGHVTAWPTLWPDTHSQFAQIQASDAFRLFALAQLPASVYAYTVLGQVPRVYWRLGEASGSVATDSSTYGSAGTYFGTVTYSKTGLIANDSDTAIGFDGSTTGVVGQTQASGIPELWFTTSAATTQCLFEQEDAHGAGTYWLRVGLNSSGKITVDNAAGYNITSGGTYNDGKTHHVFVNIGASLTLYVDGVADGSSANSLGFYIGTTAYRVGYSALKTLGGAPSRFFNGVIDEVASYDGGTPSASADYTAGTSGWNGDLSGTRIGRILTAVKWPAGPRNIDAGASTLQAASLASSKALTYIQLVEQSENGALFMDVAGKVRFIGRQTLLAAPYTTSQATFGDNTGELAWQPSPDLATDELDVWNDIRVQRTGGIEQVATDSTSQTANGTRTQPITGLLVNSDGECLDHANWNLAHFKNPQSRLRRITVNALDDPTNIYPSVLVRELVDRITVNRHGIPGGGDAFTSTALVEHIEESATPDSFDVTYSLSPAETQSYLILDDATYGVLDGSNLVGY